jgi:peptide/nickel transport system permease protein
MSQTTESLQVVSERREIRRTWVGVARIFLKNTAVLAGFIILLIIFLAAIAAPLISRYDPIAQDLSSRLMPPGPKHWLGTDIYGRDVLSRVIWGSRVSLEVGLATVGMGLVLGIAAGAISGYYPGKIDNIIMLFNDALLAMPSLLLALTIYAAIGQGKAGLANIIVAIGISMWPGFTRLMRSSVLQIRALDYIQAAVVLGASTPRILFRHILPNALAPMIVWGTLRLAVAMLIEASMSFLGVGVQPPTPSWGNITSDGRNYLQLAPWVSTAGGLAIMLAVMSLNLVGDAVRDSLDPRLRGERV